MKISLMGNQGDVKGKDAQYHVLENDILACKKGDWTAKKNLARTFQPLIKSLAEKRCKGDPGKLHELVEAGREGLYLAARKYKPTVGVSHFRVFALDYIEGRMDGTKPGGLLGRLFRRG